MKSEKCICDCRGRRATSGPASIYASSFIDDHGAACGRIAARDRRRKIPHRTGAGKALNSAAKAAVEFGYGPQWAWQGAPLGCAVSAAALIAELRRELQQAVTE